MNNQAPSKVIDRSNGSLEIHSIFESIQGEGPFAGRPAIFIRLAGCNLQCPGCDTEYTPTTPMLMTPASLVERVKASGRPLVVITGGEPFRQNLVMALASLYFHTDVTVQVETNGTLPPLGENYEQLMEKTTIVCSPKTGTINIKLEPYVDYYKYVISHDAVNAATGLPVKVLGHSSSGRIAAPRPGISPHRVYVQPADEGNGEFLMSNMDACVRACMEHGYSLCLQLHKIANLE